MRRLFLFFAVAICLCSTAKTEVKDSKTNYAREALQPYVDRGELPGAISIFYNNGVQETCCIGYADVEKKLVSLNCWGKTPTNNFGDETKCENSLSNHPYHICFISPCSIYCT